MSVTTLERVELTVEEPEIGCDEDDCHNAATHVAHFTCGCIALLCTPCVSHNLTMLAMSIGNNVVCKQCRLEIELDQISDWLISVDPL